MSDSQNTQPLTFRPLNPAVRLVLIIAGTLALGAGMIGVVLPGIPTTPLLLVTAACYMRSSERLYHGLLNNRLIGPHFHSLRVGRGLPLRVKLVALLVAWLMLGGAAVFIAESAFMQALLIGLAVAKTAFMFKIKTADQSDAPTVNHRPRAARSKSGSTLCAQDDRAE